MLFQTDPTGFIGDSRNLYRYCGNDPVNAVDPEGTDFVQIVNSIPLHNFTGIPDPSSGTGWRYFDFGPNTSNLGPGAPFWGPGRWDSQTGRPAGFISVTNSTPEQDARLLQAFNERYDNQGEYYSALFNNCFEAPQRVIDATIGDDWINDVINVFKAIFGQQDGSTDGSTGITMLYTVDGSGFLPSGDRGYSPTLLGGGYIGAYGSGAYFGQGIGSSGVDAHGNWGGNPYLGVGSFTAEPNHVRANFP